MTTIITRTSKGSPLTHSELDENFTNLNSDKVELLDLAANTGASLVGYIQSGAGAVEQTVQDRLREVVLVSDFGITGNGDETTKLANAITSAGNKVINGLGITINVTGPLTFSVPAKFCNITFNCTNNGIGLQPQGTLGSSQTPTGNLTIGQSSIVFPSNTGYIEGDLLFIISDDLWGQASEVYSQWATVKSVSGDGLTVTLATPLEYGFSTNIKIYKPTLVEGVLFENVKFIGLGADNMQKLLRPEYCRGIKLINTTFEKSGHSGLEFFRCYDIAWNNLTANRMYGTGLAYGAAFDGGCERIVGMGTTAYDTRHAITLGGTSGINRHAVFVGTISEASKDSLIDTHTSADQITFLGIGGSMNPNSSKETVMVQGSRTRVLGVTCANPSGPIMWQPFSNLADDWIELDGQCDNFQSASNQYIFQVTNRKSSGSIRSIKITGGGRQAASGGRGVYIRNAGAADINYVDVNAAIRADSHVLRLENSSTGKIKNVVARGLFERLNTSAENVYITALASGDIDNVTIDATVLSGQFGVRNVANNATNVRVTDFSRVTGQSAGKFLGTVVGGPFTGSATYDPPSLADGAGVTTTVTVTGAALGDYAQASFSSDLQGITLTAWVSAANTVSVRFQNESGGVLDLASGTIKAIVTKV